MTSPTDELLLAELCGPPESDLPWECMAVMPNVQAASGAKRAPDGALRHRSSRVELELAVVRPVRWLRSACDLLSPNVAWPGPVQVPCGLSVPLQRRIRPLEPSECDVWPLSVAFASANRRSRHRAPVLCAHTGSVTCEKPRKRSCRLPWESAWAPRTSVPPRASRVESDLVLSSSLTVEVLLPKSTPGWPPAWRLSSSAPAWSGVVGSATLLGGVSLLEDGGPGGLEGVDACRFPMAP